MNFILGFDRLPPLSEKVCMCMFCEMYSTFFAVTFEFSSVQCNYNENPNAMRPIITSYRLRISASIILASFPGRSHLQYLIAYSMQIRRRKAWEISSHAVTSGRHTGGSAR